MNTMISQPNNGAYDSPTPPKASRRPDAAWRRRLPIAAAVALLTVGAGAYLRQHNAVSAADGVEYRVATVGQSTIRKTVSTTGTLEPWSTVSIKSKAGGRVDALLVDVGSVVRKNQIIARIDPTDTIASVQTAQAAIDGAVAHTQQAEATYALQRQQSQESIASAAASLRAAQAARAAASAQLTSAQGAATAQPSQTAAAIAQARASYNEAIKNRLALDATNPQDQASAKATYDQALANQKSARVALDRQESLANQGFVAQQTVDTAQASYAVYLAQTESAQAKLATLKDQQQASIAAADARSEAAKAALQSAEAGVVDVATKRAALKQMTAALQQADAQVLAAQSALDLARANVANDTVKGYDVTYDKSQIAANQATLTNAKKTLTETVVRAPADGVVTTKDVSEGTYITSGISQNSTGTSIVEIDDLTRMYVQATVDETDIASVKEGQQVDVRFDAYSGTNFTGKVIRVEPLAVVNSNVTQFNVRVEIDNTAPGYKLLKPGMNATCDFVVQEKANALSVPTAAVQMAGPEGASVQIVQGGHAAPADAATGLPTDPNLLVGATIRRVPVQVGLTGNSETEITSGLSAGDRVVVQTIAPNADAASGLPSAPKSAFGGMGGPGGPPPGGGPRR